MTLAGLTFVVHATGDEVVRSRIADEDPREARLLSLNPFAGDKTACRVCMPIE